MCQFLFLAEIEHQTKGCKTNAPVVLEDIVVTEEGDGTKTEGEWLETEISGRGGVEKWWRTAGQENRITRGMNGAKGRALNATGHQEVDGCEV